MSAAAEHRDVPMGMERSDGLAWRAFIAQAECPRNGDNGSSTFAINISQNELQGAHGFLIQTSERPPRLRRAKLGMASSGAPD